jgi:adenylyltransferase/sulfurtransferase
VVVDATVADLNPSNIETLLEDVHLIIDGVDNFETRFLINDYSVKQGIPWIYGACVGSRGVTMNVIPQRTPCLRCVLENLPPVGTTETCDTEGIIAPIANLIASLQIAEALKILSNNLDALNTGLLTVDLWQNKMTRVDVKGLSEHADCITCKRRSYEFLSRDKTSLSTILCGRGSVQILHPNGPKLDLANLAERLKRVGGVTYNSFLLRLKLEKYELAVFPDGRSIISGTNDPAVAKGLYAKYIGM